MPESKGKKTWLLITCLMLVFISFDGWSNSDSIPSKQVNFSIYPVFGYQPETNFAFGIISFIVYDNNGHEKSAYYRPSTISPYFLYTLNNQMLVAIDFELFFKNGIYLDIKPRYYNYPDFYYGIGNDNDKEQEEIYTNEFIRLDGRLMKFLNKKWSAGLRFDIQSNSLYDFDADGQLIDGEVFGTEGGLNVALGPTVQIDTRDNILYPSTGIYARAEINVFSESLAGDFNYVNYLLDFRKYVSVKNEKNILAFQAVSNFTSGSKVPFYKLQKVGGDSRLRGIENANLYLDKQSFWMQAEYRRKLFWRLGGVAFAGFGDVAPSLGNYRFDELKYVVGLGGRFQALKHEKLNLRLDAGIGRGGQYAFYLSVKEAF